MTKKYHIATYGCQANKADSERIASKLAKQGYQPASKIEDADLVVVNMCSIRQSAVDRVLGISAKFKKLKEKNPKFKSILTGCIVKKDRPRLSKRFDRILKFKDLLECQPEYQQKSIAFIPVSNGCNNFCSYCVVPYARGLLVCRDHKNILKEAENAVQKGFREIWLLGQKVNDYKSPIDSSVNFAKLLEITNKIPGEFKLFFTSPHPENFSDELINALAKCEKFGKLLNLPVQSGDNQILKEMKRNYTVEEYKSLVKKIKEKIPEIKLSTDVIVGFPGETEKQFQNTVKLFKETKFDNAYVSKYSPRPGTASWQMKDDIPLSEKKRREKILRKIFNDSR